MRVVDVAAEPATMYCTALIQATATAAQRNPSASHVTSVNHGHVTVNGVFSAAEMDTVVRDIEAWGESFLAELPAEQKNRLSHRARAMALLKQRDARR